MSQARDATRDYSIERFLATLSTGEMDIDDATPDGSTPLMVAAGLGVSDIVRVILSKGANLAAVNDTGCTALHASANEGHSQVVAMLIEAGANPNSRDLNGTTPLYCAANNGHVDTVQLLLRSKANPLFIARSSRGKSFVPLDAAAGRGHLEVVRELIHMHGIEGCGGASGGVDALELAAADQHVDTMEVLTSAGVVDSGNALFTAASFGRESSVRFLQKKHQERQASCEGAGYLETRTPFGQTPIFVTIQGCRPCSPRITRMLVDAGVDTTSAVELKADDGSWRVVFNDTPLAYANFLLEGRVIRGKEATESQLYSLEGIRRLLMRVEAIHAVSWLWASDVPVVIYAATEGTGRATHTISTPLTSMMLILRRRAGRPRVLLASLLRHSTKP